MSATKESLAARRQQSRTQPATREIPRHPHLTLRLVVRTQSRIDSHRFVDSRVRFEAPNAPGGSAGDYAHTLLDAGSTRVRSHSSPTATRSAPSTLAIISAGWHMLHSGELYDDLGGDYYTRPDHQRHTRRLVAQLERLGHTVSLDKQAA